MFGNNIEIDSLSPPRVLLVNIVTYLILGRDYPGKQEGGEYAVAFWSARDLSCRVDVLSNLLRPLALARRGAER